MPYGAHAETEGHARPIPCLAQLPLVQVMDNGLSDRCRPAGKAFYSVAENRHVQLSCWTYRYEASDADKPSEPRDVPRNERIGPPHQRR